MTRKSIRFAHKLTWSLLIVAAVLLAGAYMRVISVVILSAIYLLIFGFVRVTIWIDDGV
jgi:hypothetical protein